MKVLFLCGALHPGHDGVGDYTRRLAGEIIRQGCEARLVALCERPQDFDASVDGCLYETQDADGTPVEVCRLHSKVPWSERIRAASRWIDGWQPDWISLQFVCYGYHRRGWAWRMGERLKSLCSRRRLHVMFHELWIGENVNAPILHRIEGMLQKRLILHMIRRLQPHVVHTHTPTYQTILDRDGVKSTLLQLFGNIPVVKSEDSVWLEGELEKQGWQFTAQERDRFWLFGFFGSLHPEWKPELLLPQIQSVAEAEGKRVGFAAIGRLGASGDRIWEKMMDDYGSLFSFARLGEQSAERVSQFLGTIDFGIASSPVALIGKSGSVAAMLDHGVPVVVPRDDWRLRFGATPAPLSHPLLFLCREEFAVILAGKHIRSGSAPILPDVASRFLESCGF